MSLPTLSLRGKVELFAPWFLRVLTKPQGLFRYRCSEGTWTWILSCFYSSVWRSFISMIVTPWSFSKRLYFHCHRRSQVLRNYPGCWRAHWICNLLVHRKPKLLSLWKRFTVAQCNSKNVHIIGIECDVTDESSVKNAYEVIMKTFGRIDAVVASAGIVFSLIFHSIHIWFARHRPQSHRARVRVIILTLCWMFNYH